MGNYNKSPEVIVKGTHKAWIGYQDIVNEIKKCIDGRKEQIILGIECYPGVRYDEIIEGLIKPLDADQVIHSDNLAYNVEKITQMIERNLTNDRVFGVMSNHKLHEFFDENKLTIARNELSNKKLTIIYGVGASIVQQPDILIYADLARWEIQGRYRSQELANWRSDNYSEDILRKYKRGYFFEWRIADRQKKQLFEQIDYLLDTNQKDNPKLVSGENYRSALIQVVETPFRLVPFFDEGIWGGQWMKEKLSLDPNVKNFAWGFDGVPEENSIYLNFSGTRLEIPSINVVFAHPVELLGDKVHARFGTEFPIRFDFLDTMNGGNLSLQVHPLTEYIQDEFGMHYTQDESYYILEGSDDASVYLGVKEGIKKEDLLNGLERAELGEIVFPDEKYINKLPAKKHDHYLIPAGTIHCSGRNTVILEISATPYIFTFKLWDWGRVGLDGLPRPVHLNHGKNNILIERDEEWVKENLVNRTETIETGKGWTEEKTGLHENQFIRTHRHWFSEKVYHSTHNSVNMLNLVEGKEAIVESPAEAFDPFIVHYAETFIIPASLKEYTIRPYGQSDGETIATIKAFVE
ncbi:class I mannose-6-phosphate isomerase [Virgibacillus litoralis]|uniref:Mannose-6-phosphate isomerase class I n=1 Tax=Virgibacillus litoralis TaxID=578221 RepID=A0ABS4HAF8_9BACI|nr:class I mannose-6-phosphate isomerase [Virgibacillus litoralis]MBP1947873.1 mannose-6-phosphate isomerase class I [Virgibacillus litoralis]